MKRHKWKDITPDFLPKREKCIICGIERNWCGGDMQGWEYFDPQSYLGSTRTTWYRPECEPNRGNTRGFGTKGSYLLNEGVVIHLNEAARLKTGTGYFESHYIAWDKIGEQLFHDYTEKCDNADLNKLRSVYNKRNEKEIIETMQNMCEESLPPDAFEKWDDVRKILENNRKALTKQ